MSNMVVRTNVFALNAHRNLTNVGLGQRQSAQRLSSGFRINSAADDAAGLAISEAMRAQIRGLDQASINTQDGVGLIQTAEGAMSTISDMVIRVRELMVQAANDTNTFQNREAIQLEIDQIMTEINDVTFRTQFNTRTLLAGGLGGEGGGPSSPVSLQWMVFNEARVLGLSQPGGIVGPGRPGNVHPNPTDRNQTSLRNSIVDLQTELYQLARRVADRKVSTGEFTPEQRSEIFDQMPNPDFDALNMLQSERTELQAIASRLENLLRQGRTAADNLFQITQDQINALGGQFAVNMDGSNVFSGDAITEWEGQAQTLLAQIRDQFDTALTDIETAMGHGINALEHMNGVIRDLVGVLGEGNERATILAAPTGDDWQDSLTLAEVIAALDPLVAGQVVPGVYWFDDNGTWVLNTQADGEGAEVTFNPAREVAGRVGWDAHADANELADYLDLDYAVDSPLALLPGIWLVYDGDDWQFNTQANGFGEEVGWDNTEGPNGTFTLPATFSVPIDSDQNSINNHILEYKETLLDLATDVLGNVNLESNAMWFQVGPNQLQGMILQLKGIHTGILGGGRGDLAMLIDVRERSGLPISEQLEIIDLAEGIVNAQRAQLGAIQNRMEFTRQSTDISSENLSAAESRIRDTDMAREMMRFTQAQVLQQAGISMLAQANQLPASILQLLQ